MNILQLPGDILKELSLYFLDYKGYHNFVLCCKYLTALGKEVASEKKTIIKRWGYSQISGLGSSTVECYTSNAHFLTHGYFQQWKRNYHDIYTLVDRCHYHQGFKVGQEICSIGNLTSLLNWKLTYNDKGQPRSVLHGNCLVFYKDRIFDVDYDNGSGCYSTTTLEFNSIWHYLPVHISPLPDDSNCKVKFQFNNCQLLRIELYHPDSDIIKYKFTPGNTDTRSRSYPKPYNTTWLFPVKENLEIYDIKGELETVICD